MASRNIQKAAQHVFGVQGNQVQVERQTAFQHVTRFAQSPVGLVFVAIGTIWFLFGLARFLRVLLDIYVLPGIPLSRFGAAKSKNQFGKGSWAVVTGATDGIGQEFALQLANKGFNIVLLSRTAEKLRQVAQQIEKATPGIKTITHSIDFSAGDEAQYAVIKAALQNLDIGVLVNNVGASHAYPVPFAEIEEEEMLRIAEINVKATLRMTRIVSPGMVQRKRGLILNLGSFSGQYPVPLLATYSATKTFLISFSQALGEELRRSNIIVQNINAYFIVSKLSKIKRPSSFIPLPKPFVARTLSKIGRQGGAAGRPSNSSVWPSHGLLDWLLTSTIAGSKTLLRINYDNSFSTRKRALKKMNAKAK